MKQNNNPSSDKKNYFAEVIESSLESFLAQCWQWNFFPSFGSLVQVENEKTITLGIVSQIQTGSMDPMRYPFPYKKTEQQLLSEQPQIFEFLKTTFKAHIVGYVDKEEKNKFYYQLTPNPCKIHAFVRNSPSTISTGFFSKPDFLHLLFAFSGQIANIDELLLAILKQLNTQKLLTHKKLDEFCQTFSLLSGNDYRRLKLFLKRIESF